MYKLPEIDLNKEKETYKKIFVENFKKFCTIQGETNFSKYESKLVLDCANGVGADTIRSIAE